MLAVDGTEPQELRKMMELELENQAEHEERIPQVFEAAGGFSPTIGIIGAVLGLIQVMQHLDNIDEVGRGIAVAFVATIYGVGAANLLFLPSAGKLKIRIRTEHQMREMMLEGVISILEGLNPRMVETKLQGFLADAPRRKNLGSPRHEPKRKELPSTRTTSAGWFPTPTSSPSSSPFSWCFFPPPKWTSARWGKSPRPFRRHFNKWVSSRRQTPALPWLPPIPCRQKTCS